MYAMLEWVCCMFFFFKQKTAYEMRISDWSSDVCSSDLHPVSQRIGGKFQTHEGAPMPDVIFPGPEGRIEGRFSPPPRPRAPVALILHPHPQGGGTMNDRITQAMYKSFVARGFATLRFNFRGVGRSQDRTSTRLNSSH